jgi:hypothetical protein
MGPCSSSASGRTNSANGTRCPKERELVQKTAIDGIVLEFRCSQRGCGGLVLHLSTTIWSGGAAAGLYLSTGLILAFLVHTYYPGALGLREWIRVVLSWPLIFFLRSK